MKLGPQVETRPQTIFRHTQRMMRETPCSWELFGQRVVEHYHGHVPEFARNFLFQVGGDIFRCAKTNAQRLKRYADSEVETNLPSELEESWVNALPQPYRADCIADLARRYGLLAVPVPKTAACALTAMQSMGEISREFGKLCETIAPVLADGQITADEAPALQETERELELLIGAANGLLSQVREHRKAGGA